MRSHSRQHLHVWSALSDRHKELYPGGADEHPGDQYGGVCYMLVTRVALGYMLRTKGRYFDPTKKQWSKNCVACDPGATEDGLTFIPSGRDLQKLPAPFDSSGVRYHSLVAEVTQSGGTGTIERFREFVVFHGTYTYPYVIAHPYLIDNDYSAVKGRHGSPGVIVEPGFFVCLHAGNSWLLIGDVLWLKEMSLRPSLSQKESNKFTSHATALTLIFRVDDLKNVTDRHR